MARKNQEIIAVGMSGGVDSAVALWRLHEAGYRVFGITARLTGETSRCCADEDIQRAAAMARRLGVAHHVVDVCASFQAEVIDRFVDEYLAGRTPSPCVVCNRAIKFGALWERAAALGASRLATGHYARITGNERTPGLSRGVDRAKDQSYFLARLSAEQLARTVLPLGGMRKVEVMQYAADHDLAARKSRESQDICFVTQGTHGEYIDVRSFKTRGPGLILDGDGRTLGRHRGIHHYTVGQRKGLGIAVGTPMYVVGLDAATNVVRVGERPAAMTGEMTVMQPGWLLGHPPGPRFRAACQIRYNHRAADCRIEALPDGRLHVLFDEPQFAVTPGQLAAFYDGDHVLGGGWIG